MQQYDFIDQRQRRWLAVILFVSVVLRLAAALYMGDRVVPLPGTYDQVTYDALAQSLLAGRGYSFTRDWWPATPANAPTAHWSFLYPLYLAAVYGLFGHHPLIARLIQAIVSGILLPLLVFRIGRRIFGARVGLTAAGLCARRLTRGRRPRPRARALFGPDAGQYSSLAFRGPRRSGSSGCPPLTGG